MLKDSNSLPEASALPPIRPVFTVESPIVLILDEMGAMRPSAGSAYPGIKFSAQAKVVKPASSISLTLSGRPIQEGTWYASSDEAWTELLTGCVPAHFLPLTAFLETEDEDGVCLQLQLAQALPPHHVEAVFENDAVAVGLAATCRAAPSGLIYDPKGDPDRFMVDSAVLSAHVSSIGTTRAKVATLKQIREVFNECLRPAS